MSATCFRTSAKSASSPKSSAYLQQSFNCSLSRRSSVFEPFHAYKASFHAFCSCTKSISFAAISRCIASSSFRMLSLCFKSSSARGSSKFVSCRIRKALCILFFTSENCFSCVSNAIVSSRCSSHSF